MLEASAAWGFLCGAVVGTVISLEKRDCKLPGCPADAKRNLV